MEYSTVELSAGFVFLKDYDLILDSIVFKIQEYQHEMYSNYLFDNSKTNNLPDIDIYDLIVSCGHSLTWCMDYYITNDDMNWLKSKGKEHFFKRLEECIDVNNSTNYYTVLPYYMKLVELFELQIG